MPNHFLILLNGFCLLEPNVFFQVLLPFQVCRFADSSSKRLWQQLAAGLGSPLPTMPCCEQARNPEPSLLRVLTLERVQHHSHMQTPTALSSPASVPCILPSSLQVLKTSLALRHIGTAVTSDRQTGGEDVFDESSPLS